jgi:hypothetical protein
MGIGDKVFEAMKGAGMGKDSEVLVPVFRAILVGVDRIPTSGSAWADPIPHTIGGQRVVVPGQFPPDGGNALQPAMGIFSQSAVPPCPISNLTAIHTKLTENALFAPGRLLRQAPFVSNLTMDERDDVTGFMGPGTDTIQTQTKSGGNPWRALMAKFAACHL